MRFGDQKPEQTELIEFLITFQVIKGQTTAGATESLKRWLINGARQDGVQIPEQFLTVELENKNRCPGCGEINGPNCGGGYCCR